MDLSFQEKSAWGSLLAIAVSSGLFYPLAVPHIANGGAFIDIMPRLIFVIGVIIVIEIVYHSIIAARSGVESSDERDKEFNLKADRLSGYVLAIRHCLDHRPYSHSQRRCGCTLCAIKFAGLGLSDVGTHCFRGV